MVSSRAWVLERPSRLRCESFPVDETVPLLRVEAVGLCGTDVHALRGRLALSYPLVLGHEIVGTLVKGPHKPRTNGSEHPRERFILAPTAPCNRCHACLAGTPTRCSSRKTYGINLGLATDPPHLSGGFSEYVAVLPGFPLIPVPDSLRNEIAVLTEPLACALSALRRAGAVLSLAGATVAVIGAGPIGLLTAIAAELMGAKVAIIERLAQRRQLAASLGLAAIGPDDVAALTGRFDHVIECAGNEAAVARAIALAERGGVVVVFGSFAADKELALAPSLVCNQELSILGTSTTHPQDFTIALRLLHWHPDRFRPIVTHRAPLFGPQPLLHFFELMERGECAKICLVP